ncbi:MAG: glutathione-regulated potassium-efflux system oxidoreductase KefF [Candidatus Competibacteraceae bacterium]|nr:glutathione-regulated potassium-efflux system oxidoreductase KefF [Candidatus Competibacteraceae bacterium]MBK8755101.1 glutathione-regulated potassium-efflux system oxidoreductase KefF [Candidatus Competibacteraceae bacterium]
MIYLVFAHPYPSQSRANRALLEAACCLPSVEVCSLYDRYPDFDIDVAAEQAALARARLIVWMHPVFWYSVPSLLKHWFDQVLTLGWAYGEGGTALQGKDCLWAPTTGGDEAAYSAFGLHQRPFIDFMRPIEATARFCGMRWHPPCVLHGANDIDTALLAVHARQLQHRLNDGLALYGDPVDTAP